MKEQSSLGPTLGRLIPTEGTKRPEEFFKGSWRFPGHIPRIT